VATILMIFPQMVTERHYQVVERQLQVVERQTQVAERRFGPFRLNLTTGLQYFGHKTGQSYKTSPVKRGN